MLLDGFMLKMKESQNKLWLQTFQVHDTYTVYYAHIILSVVNI